MSGEDENSGPSVGATTCTQPQASQSRMFHQILPPQYLDLKTTGEIAENWKLWKEKYNIYFVISRLDRESPKYQLAMFKHAIADDGLKVTMHLQGCLACKRCSVSALNCRYLNPYIKLKLIGLAIRLYQKFWKKINCRIFHDS